MSNISTIYDAIVDLLEATFPDHKKMDNPYAPDLNNDRLLTKSFGIYMSGASNSNRVLDCSLSIQRQVVIHLTRINRGTERDKDIRLSAEKALLEDHFTLLNTFYQATALDSVNSSVANFSYESDNGVEFVFAEKNNFLLITSTFTLEYLENVT